MGNSYKNGNFNLEIIYVFCVKIKCVQNSISLHFFFFFFFFFIFLSFSTYAVGNGGPQIYFDSFGTYTQGNVRHEMGGSEMKTERDRKRID